MASTNAQRAAGRRASASYSMRIDAEIDGADELWKPRRVDGVFGEPVRITAAMSPDQVFKAMVTACKALANG